MNALYFTDMEEMAQFIAAFLETGSTYVFTVTRRDHQYVLEFTGGH